MKSDQRLCQCMALKKRTKLENIALLLKAALLFKDRVVLTDVPFHLTR